MMKLIFAALSVLSFSAHSAELPNPWIQKGDALFRERKDENSARKAFENYREAFRAEKNNSDAAWRVAMGAYFIGLRFEKSEKEIQQRLPEIFGGSFERSEKYFQKAIEASPDEPLNFLFLSRLYIAWNRSKHWMN